MTTFDRFDPFERRISDAIDAIAVARRPDYLDTVLQLTARTSQRPRWSFLERWLPMDTALSRPIVGRRVPLRPLIVLALLTALVAGALTVYFGSQKRVPLPFGPAANGRIVTSEGDDLYIRDSLTAERRVLVGGEGAQIAPDFSPDGLLMTYVTSAADGDHFMVANADGSAPRQLALIPQGGNAQAAWAPDSRRIAFIYDVKLKPTLSIVSTTGVSTVIELPGLVPLNPVWSPPSGDRLMIRARIAGSETIDLYRLSPDGTGLEALKLPGTSAFGPEWTLSGPAFSPDGSRIAFNSVLTDQATDSTYFRVSTANPDGSDVRLLPSDSSTDYSQGWPVYSPDGKWIAMETWVGGFDGSAVNQVAVVPADGSGPVRMVGPSIADRGLVKMWSPDGTRLVVAVNDARTLYEVDPVSGDSSLLPYLSDLPAWQRLARP